VVYAWKKILNQLTLELGAETVQLWLQPLAARRRQDTLLLHASNQMVHAEVRDKYLNAIRHSAKSLAPELKAVELLLGDAQDPMPAADGAMPDSAPAQATEQQAPAIAAREHHLDERYTFQSYVEGASNRLAKLTAQQVASNLGASQYNPLVLYGGTGLGKTHLMHALGNAILAERPSARILYVRSEDFVSSMLKALRSEGMEQFKLKYRSVDCLLIDDIQFFAGKERTQEEFFHTFNALYDSRQQVVLSCDRFPKELDKFEQRLQSRFGWGLSVAVEPPDFETRVEILLLKAKAQAVALPDSVAELLAKRMRSNVRELEGALNTLLARAHFSGSALSLEFAQETLRDLFSVQDRSISLGSIQKTCADYFRVSLSDLLSAKRARAIARARQMAMALCKELTTHSLKDIGVAFGGRDHTTVIHACRLIDELKRTEGQSFDDWQSLMRKLVS
jgi:chromosomal replication initiator protein